MQSMNAKVWELSSKSNHMSVYFLFSIAALTSSFPLHMNAQIVGAGEFLQTGNSAELCVNFLPTYRDINLCCCSLLSTRDPQTVAGVTLLMGELF